MKMRDTDIRVCRFEKTRVSFGPGLLLTLLVCMGPGQHVSAQQSGTSTLVANAPLSTEQIVGNLVAMNLGRAHALHAYHEIRTYHLEYEGFPGNRTAEILVDVKYQSPGTKEFTILSPTGSKVIIDKVFEKLMQAEKEALAAEAQRRSALNGDNYEFTLAGYETTPAGSMYILVVQPRTKNKFLYRGRIWVDAKDFAVTRLEAEPAKNPSFWIRSSEIKQSYMKVNDFWLPERNHSVTTVRLGGHAELTIQHNSYQITNADPVSSLPTLETRSADAGRPQRAGNYK